MKPCPANPRSRGPRSFLSRALALLSVLLLVYSCTPETRYRNLAIFFDGVPNPGEVPAPGAAEETQPVVAARELEEELPAKEEKPSAYVHPPFKQFRCTSCHDMYRGKLIQRPEDGLCVKCHAVPADGTPYVHGPVSVNACLQCHHHHTSKFPHVLIQDPKTICFRCHEQRTLSKGKHHPPMAEDSEETCMKCHDPHGGSNRFFLKLSKS